MTYTVDYFIEKFSLIPYERWITSTFFTEDGRCCALGHCGQTSSVDVPDEAYALNRMVSDTLQLSIVGINDGLNQNFQQGTPKARVLSALKQIKEQGL